MCSKFAIWVLGNISYSNKIIAVFVKEYRFSAYFWKNFVIKTFTKYSKNFYQKSIYIFYATMYYKDTTKFSAIFKHYFVWKLFFSYSSFYILIVLK